VEEDVPLALTDLDEVTDAVPAAEAAGFDLPEPTSLPHPADAVAWAETLPAEALPDPDPAPSADGLPPFPVAAADSWVSDDSQSGEVGYGELGAGPPASSALFSSSGPALPLPADPGGASASSLFGEHVPQAEPVSGVPLPASGLPAGYVPGAEPASDVDLAHVPAALPSSDADIDIGPVPHADLGSDASLGDIPVATVGDSAAGSDSGPVRAVAPSSGWFTPTDGEGPAAVTPPTDAIEAELADPLPHTGHGEGSDIFASAPPPASRLAGDHSDVIAATASWDAEPARPAGRPDGARPSEIALTFDQPPGGSTIQEPADDLPEAEEVLEAEAVGGDSLFDEASGPLDSARLADAPDFGAPAGGRHEDDASSILADLIEPAPQARADTSAVRLDDPGVEATLSDEPAPAGFAHDPADGTVDFSADSGSDLFAGSRADRDAGPRFELTPEAPGKVDPFEALDEAEEPSLSSAPSSIFTAPTPPASRGSDPAADAVEFSDHPDPAAAGVVDFDAVAGPAPDRTTFSPVPDDDALDLTDPDRPALPHPSSGDVLGRAGEEGDLDWLIGSSARDAAGSSAGPASGILSRSRQPNKDVDMSDHTDEEVAGLPEGFAPQPAAPARGSGTARPVTGQPSTGSVEVDWVSASSHEEPIPSELAEPSRGRRPGRADSDPGTDDYPSGSDTSPAAGAGVNRRAGVGILLGLLLGGGIASGVFLSGAVDPSGGTKPVAGLPVVSPPPNNGGSASGPPGGAATPPAAGPVTVADARAALAAGDPARALKAIEAAGATTPEGKAARGQARFLARLRELAPDAAAPADDAALKDARADLEAVVNDPEAGKTAEGEQAAVRAAVHLGLTHELAGAPAKAREVYTAAAAKFPKAADVFRAAVDRLDATAPPRPAGTTSHRLAPADAARLAAAAAFLFVQDAPAAPAAEPAEAGGLFWRAANLAAGGKYADAAATIDRAKAAHQARARALAGRGLNPLTDPLEQIFPRTCDDLKVYWELRRTLYEHPGVGAVVRADGLGKALDAFAGYKTERDTAVATAKTAGEKLAVTEKGLLAEKAALKTEKDAAEKLAAALKTEKAAGEKLVTDLTKAKADVVAFTKEAETAKKMADDFGTKAKSLDVALAAAEKGRQDADATLAGIAAELRAGKLLPEKYAPAELLAATKSAVSRATGPDLTSLLPPGVSGGIGSAATTGTLLDLAARTGKADAAAKKAVADLAAATETYRTESARTKADYEKAAKAAADEHAVALKKTADEAAAVLTRTKTDADKLLTKTKDDADKLLTRTKTDADTAVTKAKTAATDAVTKAKADAAAEVTKAMTDAATTVTKLKADYTAALAAAEKKAADEAAAGKAALAAAEKQFRADLADAISPADALKLWLPLLVELRRPADADPALAAAARVLKTAPPGSDDAGRAQTLSALALVLKGDLAGARRLFEAARRSPAYAPTKDWARAADVGLASLSDPTAPARVAVDASPRRDPLAAARSLDAGIAAYNAGRYDVAERALAEAAVQDSANPLPWYFLGAARWAGGNPTQAREDFRQGAERERQSGAPARALGAALAPIQGPARTALEAARP
jgi:hypothetical protein